MLDCCICVYVEKCTYSELHTCALTMCTDLKTYHCSSFCFASRGLSFSFLSVHSLIGVIKPQVRGEFFAQVKSFQFALSFHTYGYPE